MGKRLPTGYGRVNWQRREVYAHRLVAEWFIGPVSAESIVRHSCDNPPCCNPAHLSIGTQHENIDDMHRRGRAAVGVRHGMAKLDEDDLARLRSLRQAGLSQRQVASILGVSQGHVSDVEQGKYHHATG